jgi:hypothetical protein
MVEEYESLVRAGRTADAKHVKRELKVQFGVDVGGVEAGEPPATERAVEPRPPENAAEPNPPARRGPGRPRKAAETASDEKK